MRLAEAGDRHLRADRRIFRLSVRQAPLPLAPVRDGLVPRGIPSALRADQFPQRLRLHPVGRDQAHHRPEAPRDRHHLRDARGRRRPLLPDPEAGERGALPEVSGARRGGDAAAAGLFLRPAGPVQISEYGRGHRRGAPLLRAHPPGVRPRTLPRFSGRARRAPRPRRDPAVPAPRRSESPGPRGSTP